MMTNQVSSNSLLICEIGPIYDFVRHSRKTKDYWAASFLFSYFMAEVAKRVGREKVLLPYLDDNPMITGMGKIDAGSVPDQLYFLLNNENKEKVRNLLKTVIKDITNDLKSEIEKASEKKGGTVFLDTDEVNSFFNFFYIMHPIKNKQPTYEEFIEAERKIKMRAALRPFAQTANPHIKKWDKCSLCGDRKKVHSEKVDTDADFYNDEHFCSVCIFKRYLWEALNDSRIVEPKYQSTSDVALSPIKKLLNEEIENSLRIEYETIIAQCKDASKELDLSEGRYFYDTFKKKFIQWKTEVAEKYPDKTKLKWLNRPFYAIVYMDGDNMGKILKAASNQFNEYIKIVSKKISEFSLKVNEIIQKYHGQLIFAGGEDVNFIIHPEWLLECIGELNKLYNDYFANDDLTKNKQGDFTLSAGAVVCYHKYPLSSAILGAGTMLKEHAKKYPNENATAISLIKGHTEVLSLRFSNKQIGDLIELKKLLLGSEISRTTPYRIREEKEILNALTDNKHKEHYLHTIIAGTRGAEKTPDEIKRIVVLLMQFHETGRDTMTDTLLYARFLAGDK